MRSSRMGIFCFVCGLRQSSAPWGDDGQSPGFEICPCCGTEFGYEDATDVGVFRARSRWRERKYAWLDPRAKPSEWDPESQLENALREG
jgi:hypothetical protein